MIFKNRNKSLAPEVNPVLVEVTRGDMVESHHRGAACVVDDKGTVLASWGDIGRPVFARSAIKPLQALPLIETGAADRFELTNREIALACASHNGQDLHVQGVNDWLTKVGFSDDILACGAHLPLHAPSAEQLHRDRYLPSQLHNNCSGKHTGFLTTAAHMNEPPQGYVELNHPVQQRVRNTLIEMVEDDLDKAPLGVDGCGIPVIGMPLQLIAYAMARFGSGHGLSAARAKAAKRIARAMMSEPFMVAGDERFCTDMMSAGRNEVMVKTGAEGVYVAALPNQGLGLSVKVDDGSKRAADVAIAALLHRFAKLENRGKEFLANVQRMPVKNAAGKLVGITRLASGWL